jgi:hypothetical protein
MAIGAGIGIVGGSRTVGKALGVKGDDVARTAGVGGGPKPPKSTAQQGHAGRVSTRVPFAKGPVEDHLANEKLTISTQQFRDDPKLAAKAQAKIHTYSGFSVRQGEKPMETIERFQKQVTDNLLFLYDNIAENIVDRSRQWYVGARKVVDDWTTEYQGLTDTQAASVIAALSPQNEWNNNVSIAKRVIDIFMNRMDTRFSTDMEKVAATVAPKKIHKPILDRIRGKTLAEAYAMGDFEAGMWIRMFDEAYGDRGVRSLSPEGNFGDYMRTGKGEPTAKRWNSFAEVAKAISVLRDPSPARISDALGQGHKVRNFYNNMLDPDAPMGDVTIDTHAAAAAHLRPFSSKDEIAVEAMRGIGHAKTGSSGLYGLYADAYREAANQRGVLPREMQSVTWEAVKTLFTPSFKTATKRGKSDPIQAIWLAHEAGDISADEARRQIFAAAGGIDNPSWAKPGSGAGRDATLRNALVEDGLSRNGGPGSPQPAGAGRLGSGKRNAPSGVGQPARGLGEDLPPIKGAGFTGFPGGSRKPSTPKTNAFAQKPGKIGTRIADGAAIATLGLQGGTADADTGGLSAELQKANERIALAEKTTADTRSGITKLQSQLEMLQDPAGDIAAKQSILKLRGRKLGTTGPEGDGVDGVDGPNTIAAINDEAAKIEAAIAREQANLEKAQIAETKALDAAKQVRMQKIQADAQPGKNTELAREFGPYGGVAAGIAAAYLMRRGAGKKFYKASQSAADSANALLTDAPINARAGVQHPNGINVRATKLNDFARQGGAPSGTTPFDDKQTGSFRPRAKKNTVDPSDLYPNPGFMASRLRIPDYGWSATGLIEAQVAGGLRAKEEKKIATYEADVERFALAGDEAGLQRASASLQQAKNMYAIASAFERAGYAYAATRMVAGLKDPYKFVRPDIKAYEKEASSLRTAISKK